MDDVLSHIFIRVSSTASPKLGMGECDSKARTQLLSALATLGFNGPNPTKQTITNSLSLSVSNVTISFCLSLAHSHIRPNNLY